MKVNLLRELCYGSRHTFEKKMYPWQPHSTFLSLFSPIHISIRFLSVFPFLRFYLSHYSFLGRVLKVLTVLLYPAPKRGTAYPTVFIFSSIPGHPNALFDPSIYLVYQSLPPPNTVATSIILSPTSRF